jgi:hypothetical protein
MLEGTEVSPGTCALEMVFARYLRSWNGAARLRAANRCRFAFGRERGGDRIRMLEATCCPVQAASSHKEVAYFVLHRRKVVVRRGSRSGSSLPLLKFRMRCRVTSNRPIAHRGAGLMTTPQREYKDLFTSIRSSSTTH